MDVKLSNKKNKNNYSLRIKAKSYLVKFEIPGVRFDPSGTACKPKPFPPEPFSCSHGYHQHKPAQQAVRNDQYHPAPPKPPLRRPDLKEPVWTGSRRAEPSLEHQFLKAGLLPAAYLGLRGYKYHHLKFQLLFRCFPVPENRIRIVKKEA